MGNLNDISDRLTPSTPIDLTFDADTGLPSDLQTVILIGHRAAGASSGTAVNYQVVNIDNAGDPVAASGEVATKFGDGSELAKMVLAAINSIAATGDSDFPTIQCVPLQNSDTDFGATDAALTAVSRVHADFVVSPYDATNTVLRGKLNSTCATMSGAERVMNNQYGTIGVAFNRSVSDPSTLDSPDSQYLSLHWMPDTGTGGNAPAYSIAEMAAVAGARMAGTTVPFNPQDSTVLGNVAAPAQTSDWITVGLGLESETALQKGWSPWKVKPNGDVAFVRTVTARITNNGVPTKAYIDVQDFQVLYYWRKTQFARVQQPDFQNRKASKQKLQDYRAELIRLAGVFEDQNMFQNVALLAPQFQAARSTTDRSRFDSKTPVNVIPGLHVLANNTAAGTQFDTVTL